MKTVEAVTNKDDIAAVGRLLLKHHGEQFSDIWNLGIQLALRITDLLSITFDDVEGTHLKLNEQKTSKAAKILLNDKAKSIIERRKTDNPTHVYLFQSTGRNVKTVKALTRQSVGQAFKAVGDIVGLDLSTHSMRKTRGYHMYKVSHDIGAVMKMLNHSSAIVTLRYIGIEQEDLDNNQATLVL